MSLTSRKSGPLSMATSSNNAIAASIKSHSINRPPLFNGSNYQFWSNRMSIFMRSYDYEMWDVVMDDPYMPMKTKARNEESKFKANGRKLK